MKVQNICSNSYSSLMYKKVNNNIHFTNIKIYISTHTIKLQ